MHNRSMQTSPVFFYLAIISALALLVFIIAWLRLRRLQNRQAHALSALCDAMDRLAENQNYSIRLKPDETAALPAVTNSFNALLTQLQAREIKHTRYIGNLEQQVQARNAELAESIRQRLLWLENLAYFLRHELKNSTLGIRSSLDLIERRLHTGDIDKYLQRARSSVNFMVKLLEKVGEASRLESDFDDETKLVLDLGQLISQQLETYQAIYQNKTLLADCQSGVHILGNSTRMIQLLDKLVSNAVDYGKPDTPILVTVGQQNGQAVLAVSNEGEVLPADKKRIFELFVSQRDNVHKDSGNLGLGLYMVKLIAEAHGGTVSAEDLPAQKGAVFIVRLPLA